MMTHSFSVAFISGQRSRAVASASQCFLLSASSCGQDQPGSDADLLVDVPPDMGLLGLGRVQAELKPTVRADAERDLVAV